MNEELYHYGVKGMKWGVRHDRKNSESYSITTKNNDKLVFERNKGGALGRALGKISPKIKKEQENTYNYLIKDSKGRTVGDYQMYRKSPDEMNMVWGSVKKKYRGRGYMTAMMEQGEKIAKKYGAKKLTGEVVGNSPDMQHIVDKKDYKKVGEIRTQEMLDIWGGLTLIEKDLK